MLKNKYLNTILFIIFLLNIRAWPQDIKEKGASWKYLIERKITLQDNDFKKTEVHIDRAFIYYGKWAEKAGGQVKDVPQVVYIDSNDEPLNQARYFLEPIRPVDPNKFGLAQNIFENIGSKSDLPARSYLIPRDFSSFPFKPKDALREGLNWSRTIYVFYGEIFAPELVFPANINHKVRGYEIKNGRNCAVIDYTISGVYEFQSGFGKYAIEGSGTAYYDSAEEIIVEKEQTISWTIFAAMLDILNDGTTKKRIQQDNVESVSIKISLQNEKDPGSIESLETEQSSAEKPFRFGLAIAGTMIATIVIACLFLFFRKIKSTKLNKNNNH